VEMDLGSGMSYHVSGNAMDRPGWGLISTYAVGQVEPTHWADYSIFLVELTRRVDPPPRVWRIAHTHCADQESHSYGSDPFAKLNTRGDRIYWTSNWDDPDGRRDVYRADLPEGWHEALFEPLCQDGDTRACGLDEGICQPGTQRCGSGSWGGCEGAVEPQAEVCGDGVDNNCNGAVDERCDLDAGGADQGGADQGGGTGDPPPDGGSGVVDGAWSPVDQGGSACTPTCLDETTLQSCGPSGEAVVLPCQTGARCEEAQCRGGADAGRAAAAAPQRQGGCSCRVAVGALPPVAWGGMLLGGLLWRWRRRDAVGADPRRRCAR